MHTCPIGQPGSNLHLPQHFFYLPRASVSVKPCLQIRHLLHWELKRKDPQLNWYNVAFIISPTTQWEYMGWRLLEALEMITLLNHYITNHL